MGAREEGGCKETCTLSAGYDNQHSSPSADRPLRCASLRFPPSRRPPKLTRHLSPLSLPAVAPLIMFVFPSAPLRSKHMGGALERGESSRSACSARSSRVPLAPLSLASLAGASGWRLVLLLRRVVTLLLVAPFAPLRSHSSLALRAGGRRCRPARGSSLLRGRSPSLPSRLSLLAAPGAASLAASPLRSLPAPPLRASGRVRHLGSRRCGGVVGSSFLFRGCSCVARLVLLCVALSLRSRLRRAFPAAAASLPTLRFPAAPQLSRAALLRSSAPLRRALLPAASLWSSARSAPLLRRSPSVACRRELPPLVALAIARGRKISARAQRLLRARWFKDAAKAALKSGGSWGQSPPAPHFPRPADAGKIPRKNLAKDVLRWYNSTRKEEGQCQHLKSWKRLASVAPK